MKIIYKAIDGHGAHVRDVIDASNVEQAIEDLRRDGLFVTDVRVADKPETPFRSTAATVQHVPGRLTLGELLFFTRQMAMLLRAGSPVVPALQAIGRQMRGGARAMVDQLSRDLESGRGLATAMKDFPGTFSDVYVAVVHAGEMSANLGDMFSRLAALVGRQRELRNRVVAAAAYPALLIFLSIAIVITMVAFVVPRFKALFESLNTALPASTEWLFALSFLIRERWPWLVGAACVMIAGGVGLTATAAGRRRLADLKTHLPLLGGLFARCLQAQMFRVMGLLLESRVGIMDALNLVKPISTNRAYQSLCVSMHKELIEGRRLSEAMMRSSLVAPVIAQAVAVGEESGRVDQAMLFVADVLDEENAQKINTITKLLEPVILIIMGSFVGLIALSLFIPLFDLAAMAK